MSSADDDGSGEAPQSLSTHTHFFRGEEELEAAVSILAERAAKGRVPRLWSAGCSLGAEPYTLAILCAERAIHATIHASDLNPAALVAARAASYPALALRNTPDHLLERYFERRGGRYVVAPHITCRVTFQQGDLRTDPLPLPPDDPRGWDVIVCRNVLIYYDVDTASAIAARLATALRSDGVLIVGSADSLAFRASEPLRLTRQGAVTAYACVPPHLRSTGEGGAERGARVTWEPYSGYFLSAAPADGPVRGVARGAAAGAHPADGFAAALALGCRELASHAWDAAEAALLRAQRAAPLAPEPPLYLGVLRRKQGRFDEAFAHLRRAVFLSPDCWTASYLLAGAWERVGDRERARLELARALKTLERAGASAAPPAGAEVAGLAFDPAEVARICRERLGL